MKGKVRTAVIVLLVLLLAAVQAVVISQVMAGSQVLWKQQCPAYADLSFVPEQGGVNVVCSVGDGIDVHRTR